MRIASDRLTAPPDSAAAEVGVGLADFASGPVPQPEAATLAAVVPTEGSADDGPSPPTPCSDRRSRADPLPAMAREPWRYGFFHALRLVEAAHPELPRLGQARRPLDEPVRLAQQADLAFAPATLAGVDADDRGGRPRIDVRFFGLFGPNGPLPLPLTSLARERRLHRGDETLQRFADLFHHRLLLLFYRAWADAQPTASLDRPQDDRFADRVGALIGCGGAPWRGRSEVSDHARLAFAGVYARQVRNADGLERVLAGLLGRPVRVETFVGRWMALPVAERTRIGGRVARRRQSTAQLGTSAVLGRAVYDRQHHFRLHVGPLDLGAFEALLPPGSELPGVRALVALYVGDELGWDLELSLMPGEVPECRPGHYGRLGWSTWLAGRPRDRAATLRLQPRAWPPAQPEARQTPATVRSHR